MADYVFLTRQQIDCLVASEREAYVRRLQTDKKFLRAYNEWLRSPQGAPQSLADREEAEVKRSLKWDQRYGPYSHEATDLMRSMDDAQRVRTRRISSLESSIRHRWLEDHTLNEYSLNFVRYTTHKSLEAHDTSTSTVDVRRGLDAYWSAIKRRDIQYVCDQITRLREIEAEIIQNPQLRDEPKAELKNIRQIIANCEKDRDDLGEIIMREDEKKYIGLQRTDIEIKDQYAAKRDEVYLHGGQIYKDGKLITIEPKLPEKPDKAKYKGNTKGFKAAMAEYEEALAAHNSQKYEFMSADRLEQKLAHTNKRSTQITARMSTVGVVAAVALMGLTPLGPAGIAIGLGITVVSDVVVQIANRLIQRVDKNKYDKSTKEFHTREANGIKNEVCEDEYRTYWMEKNAAHYRDMDPTRKATLMEADFQKAFSEYCADRQCYMPKDEQKYAAFVDELKKNPRLLAQFVCYDGRSKESYDVLVREIEANPSAYFDRIPKFNEKMPIEQEMQYRKLTEQLTHQEVRARLKSNDPRFLLTKPVKGKHSDLDYSCFSDPYYGQRRENNGAVVSYSTPQRLVKAVKTVATILGRRMEKGDTTVQISADLESPKKKESKKKTAERGTEEAVTEERTPKTAAPTRDREEPGPEITTPETELTVGDLLGKEADAEYERAEEERKKAEAERAKTEAEEAAKTEDKDKTDGKEAEEGKDTGAAGSKDEGKEDTDR